MSDRYRRRFDELQSRNEGAFTGFLVLGDPTLDVSAKLLGTLVESGCDMIEAGIPFSDPLADGPVIQAAMERALDSGTTTELALNQLREFRHADDRTPVGLLVYANLVVARGIDRFYGECRDSGVDSVLVADAPLHECEPFCKSATAHQVCPVLLCPPNIDEQRVERLAHLAQGYTYLLSRSGVTGTTHTPGRPVEEVLQMLRRFKAPPPLLGFGISRPEHVRNAIQSGAHGVICGSAIVERVARLSDQPHERDLDDLRKFIREMKSATRR